MPYRVIWLKRGGEWKILTRSTRVRAGYREPVFTSDPADTRIKTYMTSIGAMKEMARMRKAGYNVIVTDACTGNELQESADYAAATRELVKR